MELNIISIRSIMANDLLLLCLSTILMLFNNKLVFLTLYTLTMSALSFLSHLMSVGFEMRIFLSIEVGTFISKLVHLATRERH